MAVGWEQDESETNDYNSELVLQLSSASVDVNAELTVYFVIIVLLQIVKCITCAKYKLKYCIPCVVTNYA